LQRLAVEKDGGRCFLKENRSMGFNTRPFRLERAVCVVAVLAACGARAELAPNPDKPAPGMERGTWALEPWGNSGSVEKITADGRKYLKLIYSADKKEKTAYKHATSLGLDKEGKIRFYVYCAEDNPPQVALAVSTTPAFRWHETRPTDLKKGWNKVEHAIGGNAWKTAETKWEHRAALAPVEDVRTVDLIVLNGERSGALLVEGLSYDTDTRGKEIAIAIKDLQSEDLEARGKAEKALIAIGRPAVEALSQVAGDERPEVMLRAASALRKIEEAPEAPPADPQVRVEMEKQREEQGFDEARRRAEYALRGLEAQRLKLLQLFKEASAELNLGRAELEKFKAVDADKKTIFGNTLDRMETVLKEIQPLLESSASAPAPAKEKDK
jgi:hypothetical protein